MPLCHLCTHSQPPALLHIFLKHRSGISLTPRPHSCINTRIITQPEHYFDFKTCCILKREKKHRSFCSIAKYSLTMTDLVSFILAAHSLELRIATVLWACGHSFREHVYSSYSGGWAEWGLMQYCTPSALEQRGEGWVIQRRKICSSMMSLNVCILISVFKWQSPSKIISSFNTWWAVSRTNATEDSHSN